MVLQACSRLDSRFSAVVDTTDDTVGRACDTWPDRLYVVDSEGRVLYTGRRDPRGFRSDEPAGFLAERFGP